MPNCYYTCDLLPLDLIVEAGYSPRWLGGHLRDPSAPARREALGVHPMTCPYVTKLVAAAEEVLTMTGGGAAAGSPTGAAAGASAGDRLVVPGGCDAMRRLGDLLAASYPGRVFVLSMPRSSGTAVAEALASDLRRLDEWLRAGLAAGPAGAPGAAAAEAAPLPVAVPPSVDYPAPPRPGGVFLVAGPLSDDSLLRLIDKLGLHVSGLESCTSPDRWKPMAAAAAGARGGALDYLALANLVLSAGMCPRRSTTDRRAHLARRLDEARPTSIIYARQSFCDPGAYDALLVAQLAGERGLPYLEIEVDFPFDAGGPLRTRVEAFLEAQLLDDDLLAGAASADLPDNDLFED
jgi:hypothetical protein